MTVQIRPIEDPDLEPVRQMLIANAWGPRVADAAVFRQLIAASPIARVAVIHGQVVGFLRALTDGVFNGYISMLVVDAQHRRQGVGRALVQAVMGDDPRMGWVLRAGRDGAADFWAAVGFAPSSVAMERPGQRLQPLPVEAYAQRAVELAAQRPRVQPLLAQPTAAAAPDAQAATGLATGPLSGHIEPGAATSASAADNPDSRAPFEAVIYAADLPTLARFYQRALGLQTLEAGEDFTSLSAPGWVLHLVAMPKALAAANQPAQPPAAREDTPIKLSFAVPDLEDCRARIESAGGRLKPTEQAWVWRGQRHLDGVDPEGNVFQLRQKS